MMITVLCYGDSNTYGFVPETGMRYPRDVRYPGRLQMLLGESGSSILTDRQAEIRLLQYVFGHVKITLGDIGKISMCKRILKEQTSSQGDILISAAGTIGRTVRFDGKPAYFQDSNIVWIVNDESIVSKDFLYYIYQLKPWKASTGGTIARLYNDNIARAEIDVPSIDIQKKVVKTLERFDKLCNDISDGLPAEIEARQKQYEFYWDMLLTFRKME